MPSPFDPAATPTGGFTACPVVPTAPTGPPVPDDLSCSLTLPGEPHSAQIARSAVRAALHAHGLDPLAPAAVQVTGELVGATWYLDPARSLYLSVRHREGALRLTVYDGHAPTRTPASPRTARRAGRSALRLMAAVVRECGGAWGIEGSREPGGGTRTWAALPATGAVGYLAA